MTEPKHISPRLGRTSAVLLSLVLLATIALFVDYLRNPDSYSPASPQQPSLYMLGLMGSIYGWTAGMCWLTTAVPHRYPRWLLQAGLVAAFAWPLQAFGPGVYLRYLSGLGGMVFFQAMLFHWLGVPRWSAGRDTVEPSSTSRTQQFGIGEIITATTCIAALLGIAIRYQTPDVGFAVYWMVNILFWILAPLMAAAIVTAVLRQGELRRSIGWFLIAIVISAVGIAGLTAAEFSLANTENEVSVTAVAYASIILSYLVVIALTATAGRLERMTNVQ